MEQEIKVIVLQSGDILISQVEEVPALDIGDPNCKLIAPYSLKESTESTTPSISPWLGSYTDENEVMMCSDKILTLVEPHKSIVDSYLKLAVTTEPATEE